MRDESLIEIMMQEAARAVPWGIMFLLVLLIGSMWLKQDAKSVAAFASQAMVSDVKSAVLNPKLFIPLKQKAKQAIRYTAHTAIEEAKHAVLRSDTFVPMKRKIKEAIEYTATTAANQYERAQRDLAKRR